MAKKKKKTMMQERQIWKMGSSSSLEPKLMLNYNVLIKATFRPKVEDPNSRLGFGLAWP